MHFHLAPMTEVDAEMVANWRYEGRFGLHDWAEDSEMLADFLRWPDLYYAVWDEGNNLVGFAQFARLWGDTDTLSVVWGLRPDLTGKGYGLVFVDSCLAFARTRYEPLRFILGVWAFNQRAIRVYEQADFRSMRVFNAETRFGILQFVEMVRDEHRLKIPLPEQDASEP